MADENKTERVQLLMTPSELKAIDDWSFENRIRGRAEAMRRLCQMGIGLDSEAKNIINRSAKVTEQAKQAILLTVGVLRNDGSLQFKNAAEAIVDTLGAAASLQGFLNMLVSASDNIKETVTEDEIRTFKEALMKASSDLSQKMKVEKPN